MNRYLQKIVISQENYGAQIAGLREGDVIQKIDGGSTKDIDVKVLLAKMVAVYSSKNNVELEIKGTDSITKSISLRKGYVLNWSKANDRLRVSGLHMASCITGTT